MKTHAVKRHKAKTLLIDVAESIGATLGTIAAKANAVQDMARNSVTGPPAQKAKKSGGRAKTRIAAVGSTLAKGVRGGVRRATSAAKRIARAGSAKAPKARRAKR